MKMATAREGSACYSEITPPARFTRSSSSACAAARQAAGEVSVGGASVARVPQVSHSAV